MPGITCYTVRIQSFANIHQFFIRLVDALFMAQQAPRRR